MVSSIKSISLHQVIPPLLYAGLGKKSVLETFTNAYVIERASVSTLPFAIDDPANKPAKGADLNEVVVDLYNHGQCGTMRKGAVLPVSAPLIATNYPLKEDERLVIIPVTI